MTKAEQRRRHKDKETFGEDSRVMLKWGLNTMEHLSKQVQTRHRCLLTPALLSVLMLSSNEIVEC